MQGVMCVSIVIALLMGTILVTPQASSGTGSDVQEPSTWVDHIVISEVLTECEGTEDHEFVELYNPTNSDISLIGWDILYDSTAFDVWNIKYTISSMLRLMPSMILRRISLLFLKYGRICLICAPIFKKEFGG